MRFVYVASPVYCLGRNVFGAAFPSAVVARFRLLVGACWVCLAPRLDGAGRGAMGSYCGCTFSRFSRFHHALLYVFPLLLFRSVTIRGPTWVTTPVIPRSSLSRFVIRTVSPTEIVFVATWRASRLAGAVRARCIRCISCASRRPVSSMIRWRAAVDSTRRIRNLVSSLIRLSSSSSIIRWLAFQGGEL